MNPEFNLLKWRTLPFDQKATLLDGVRIISQHPRKPGIIVRGLGYLR
jgi:hypothetical protein